MTPKNRRRKRTNGGTLAEIFATEEGAGAKPAEGTTRVSAPLQLEVQPGSAAYRLLALMKRVSREHYSAGWHDHLEDLLWGDLQDFRKGQKQDLLCRMTREDLTELDTAQRLAKCWWQLPEHGVEPVMIVNWPA